MSSTGLPSISRMGGYSDAISIMPNPFDTAIRAYSQVETERAAAGKTIMGSSQGSSSPVQQEQLAFAMAVREGAMRQLDAELVSDSARLDSAAAVDPVARAAVLRSTLLKHHGDEAAGSTPAGMALRRYHYSKRPEAARMIDAMSDSWTNPGHGLSITRPGEGGGQQTTRQYSWEEISGLVTSGDEHALRAVSSAAADSSSLQAFGSLFELRVDVSNKQLLSPVASRQREAAESVLSNMVQKEALEAATAAAIAAGEEPTFSSPTFAHYFKGISQEFARGSQETLDRLSGLARTEGRPLASLAVDFRDAATLSASKGQAIDIQQATALRGGLVDFLKGKGLEAPAVQAVTGTVGWDPNKIAAAHVILEGSAAQGPSNFLANPQGAQFQQRLQDLAPAIEHAAALRTTSPAVADQILHQIKGQPLAMQSQVLSTFREAGLSTSEMAAIGTDVGHAVDLARQGGAEVLKARVGSLAQLRTAQTAMGVPVGDLVDLQVLSQATNPLSQNRVARLAALGYGKKELLDSIKNDRVNALKEMDSGVWTTLSGVTLPAGEPPKEIVSENSSETGQAAMGEAVTKEKISAKFIQPGTAGANPFANSEMRIGGKAAAVHASEIVEKVGSEGYDEFMRVAGIRGVSPENAQAYWQAGMGYHGLKNRVKDLEANLKKYPEGTVDYSDTLSQMNTLKATLHEFDPTATDTRPQVLALEIAKKDPGFEKAPPAVSAAFLERLETAMADAPAEIRRLPPEKQELYATLVAKQSLLKDIAQRSADVGAALELAMGTQGILRPRDIVRTASSAYRPYFAELSASRGLDTGYSISTEYQTKADRLLSEARSLIRLENAFPRKQDKAAKPVDPTAATE